MPCASGNPVPWRAFLEMYKSTPWCLTWAGVGMASGKALSLCSRTLTPCHLSEVGQTPWAAGVLEHACGVSLSVHGQSLIKVGWLGKQVTPAIWYGISSLAWCEMAQTESYWLVDLGHIKLYRRRLRKKNKQKPSWTPRILGWCFMGHFAMVRFSIETPISIFICWSMYCLDLSIDFPPLYSPGDWRRAVEELLLSIEVNLLAQPDSARSFGKEGCIFL